LIQRYRYLPFVLEVATALAAAALRPQSFAAFVRAFIVAIGGFVTFSVFYSPQFYLWFIPPVAFAGSVGMLAPTIALGWVTILYFPVAFLRAYGTVAFRVAVAAVTILRSSLILVAFVSLVRLRATSNAGQTGPAHSN
jgi:hypothetical protein